MGDTAVAVVLVNQHTTLTELIQGVGRLRGILNQQSAKIVLDKESSLIIRNTLGKSETDPLTLLDLVCYCIKREGQSLGVANFRSLSLQLDALLEQFFWDGVLNAPPKQKDAALNELRSIRQHIVQSTEDDPLKRPSLTLDPVDTAIALKRVTDSFQEKIAAINALKSWSLSKIDPQAMEITRKRIQSKMPYSKNVYLHHTLDTSQTTETTAAQLTEMKISAQETTTAQTQTLSTDDTETESSRYSWSSAFSQKTPLTRTCEIEPCSLKGSLSDVRLQKKLGTNKAKFEKTQLCISKNTLCTFDGDTPEHPGWVNGYSKPLNYIAQLKDGRFVIVDAQEAENILKNPESVQMLWLINHGPLIPSKNMPSQMSQMKKMEEEVMLLRESLEDI